MTHLSTFSARTDWLHIYESMLTARELDILEDSYAARGEAFFHVSASGHEAMAVFHRHLSHDDWLHCHYRDKALMLARGMTAEMFFLSLFAKKDSHSAGRQMSAHLSDRELKLLSLVGPVGNNALQAAGIAAELKSQKKEGIVFCAMGEGTTQEGEVLEAIGESSRSKLPVLWVVEDNGFAISTLTEGKTFYQTAEGDLDQFHGIPIHFGSATDAISLDTKIAEVTEIIRSESKPVILVIRGERLNSHTNADDHTIYRTEEEISKIRKEGDPLPILRTFLINEGHSEEELKALELRVKEETLASAEKAQISDEPEACFDSKSPLPEAMQHSSYEQCGLPESEGMTMLESMRTVLEHHLESNDKVSLFGEDIEDPKGDVFGLTKGLSTRFPGRVVNSPLSESTIVGMGIGRALAGGLSVGFLQFADFLPLALNQIVSEMGSMYWRTQGHWQCPMIVMVSCGGYRPGLGPFHGQSLEALVAHVPGVDVMMPSTAADAAGMLNSAFQSGRPTLFFYPKSCLNLSNARTSENPVEQHALPGKARCLKKGKDMTLVGWGNTVQRCLEASEKLEQTGVSCEVYDLRSISPWDEDTILHSAEKTERLVVVHEDNKTCGMGAEILATIAERSKKHIQVKRITRPDTFVPFHFGNHLEVLPSIKRIVNECAEMAGFEANWEEEKQNAEGVYTVEAVGTSPSDETVLITEWKIQVGDVVEKDQLLCAYEAEKAVAELHSPEAGEILELLIAEGDRVKVGAPLLQMKPSSKVHLKPPTQEKLTEVHFVGRKKASVPAPTFQIGGARTVVPVFLNHVVGTAAGLVEENEAVLQRFEDRASGDIEKTTGIERRRKVAIGEDSLSLAITASQRVLEQSELSISDIDLIMVATGNPGLVSPSLACRLLHSLAGSSLEIPAYDFSAACAGYLFGMKQAWDVLQSHPDWRILLVTSEVLSPLVNEQDYNTAILFSDAATASIISGREEEGTRFRIRQPVISSKGEPGELLVVPTAGSGNTISMNGQKVFSEGVRKMSTILREACKQSEVELNELELVVPHQANQRIMDSVGRKLGVPQEKVYSNIKDYGNTSASTIPLALSEIFNDGTLKPSKIGLTAFGGGFTFGAAVLEEI
jgi:2-oxoisovalerate dehydrogenase E1 component